MFKTIKNALKTPEVRKKLLYTLLLIVIFRLGCYITVPAVDSFTLSEQMSSATGTLTGLIDTISGGAFSRLSIFAMTITPYITSSIVIQLLAMIIPSLEKMMKEGGEVGKQKVNKYTKLLTLVLSPLIISYSKSELALDGLTLIFPEIVLFAKPISLDSIDKLLTGKALIFNVYSLVTLNDNFLAVVNLSTIVEII